MAKQKNTSKETVKSDNGSSRIGGKYAKGDSRSKSMTGNIKPQKGC